jgi:hypothetical protein
MQSSEPVRIADVARESFEGKRVIDAAINSARPPRLRLARAAITSSLSSGDGSVNSATIHE